MRVTMLFRLLMLIFMFSFIGVYGRSSGGTVHVNGYYRSNGTYVAPHYRSAPDGNFYNNWSTKGNINPYTGEEGTKTIDPNSHTVTYGSGGSSINTSSDTVVDTKENKVLEVPEHAKLNYFRNGWECERGYHQAGNACEPVQIPDNGKLDYFGHQWECQRGYVQVGNSCGAVNVPVNGKLDYFGHSWECNRGYVQAGNECRPVIVPEHGKLDYFGHAWGCERGYYRTGNECREVAVPENGKLNYFGTDWECTRGYIRLENRCTRN